MSDINTPTALDASAAPTKPVVDFFAEDVPESTLPVVAETAGEIVPFQPLNFPDIKAVGSLVSTANFGPEQWVKVDLYASTVNFENALELGTWGTGPLEANARVLDELLKGRNASEAGIGGDLLIALKRARGEFEKFDFDEIQKQLAINPKTNEISLSAYMSKIPGLGKYFDQLQYLVDRNTDILSLFTDIEKKAQVRRRRLIEDDAQITYYRKGAHKNFRELSLYIVAGEKALLQGSEMYRERSIALAHNPDPIEAASLRTLRGNLIRFHTHLVRLQEFLVSGVTVNELQMQMGSEAASITIDKITDMLTIEVPQFKHAMYAIVVAWDIRKAQHEGGEFSDAANKAKGIASSIMGAAYLEAKKSQGDVLEDVKRLAEASKKLLEVMDEGLRLEEEATQNRREAMVKLVEVRDSFAAGIARNAEKVQKSMP